jgi:hypothetical protein
MGTSIDYSTVAHETIYSHITGGPGSAELADASQGWQNVAARLQELQDCVDQAVREIGAAQQGAAADAATHATMALTPWLGDGVTAAHQMAVRISEQAASFAHTRDNMPPPQTVPEVSFNQDPGTWMADHAVEWLPGIQTEHEGALVAAQQAEQRAQELMSAYQGTSNENLTIHLQFAAAPTVVAEVADPGPGGASVGGALGGWSVHPSSAHPGTANPDLAHAGWIETGHGASAPAATAPQLAGVHQATAPATTSPQFADGYPSPMDQPTAGSGSVRPAAAAPFGPSPTLAGPAAASDRLRGGSRFTGGGMSHGAGFGPRPTTTYSSTTSSAGDSRPGSAGHGNSLPGSAEPAGGWRAVRGGTGFSDAPLGVTGGAGRDAGGTEHRRPSYLIEQDTSAIVGELPRVAPPVIGADEGCR